MYKQIQLQHIGKRNAIPASELNVGDVMICNYGDTQTFTRLEMSKSRKSIYYTVLCNGKLYDGRTSATRLFAVERIN